MSFSDQAQEIHANHEVNRLITLARGCCSSNKPVKVCSTSSLSIDQNEVNRQLTFSFHLRNCCHRIKNGPKSKCGEGWRK